MPSWPSSSSQPVLTGPWRAFITFEAANIDSPPSRAPAKITTGTSMENGPLPVLNRSSPLAISAITPATANTAWPPTLNSRTNSTSAAMNRITPEAFSGSWAVPKRPRSRAMAPSTPGATMPGAKNSNAIPANPAVSSR